MGLNAGISLTAVSSAQMQGDIMQEGVCAQRMHSSRKSQFIRQKWGILGLLGIFLPI